MTRDLVIRLQCTLCRGGDDEGPGGAFTDFERDTENENVVRCARCGKRHHTDSLHAVEP